MEIEFIMSFYLIVMIY